jgi:cation transport protein ChaC
MRLTPELVARVHRDIPDPGPLATTTLSTEEDHQAELAKLLAGRPPSGEVWVFAYGSLIWLPGCAVAETRPALARGYSRKFCLGWDRRFRGNEEHRGLMLALDRGGQCHGLAQRLPDGAVEENLLRLFRREMSLRPSAFPPRWINLRTDAGPLRAIAFVIDRKGRAYVTGVAMEEIADALSRAVGFRGSMAEYLYSTVRHLEDLGLHDRYLWRMQEMVAERIERQTAASPAA